MVDRLAEDHAHARAGLRAGWIPGMTVEPVRVRTNIVMFPTAALPHATLIALAAERGVRLAELGRASSAR